jgi:hypothetical protein
VDEARHATLAWQFVKWVIDENPAGLRVAALLGREAPHASELAVAAARERRFGAT